MIMSVLPIESKLTVDELALPSDSTEAVPSMSELTTGTVSESAFADSGSPSDCNERDVPFFWLLRHMVV
jgi:hypothetical protein